MKLRGAPNAPRLVSLAASLAGAAVLLAGCAYQLGPSSGATPGARSVAIQPFENQSLEPRVTEAIATALRGQIQQEGTFHLARHGEADVLVSGTVRSIERHEESFLPRDTRTIRDYRMEIVAHVVATERGSGRKVLDQDVTGHTMLRVQSDMPSAERQALPLLAANLARNIVSLLVDGSW